MEYINVKKGYTKENIEKIAEIIQSGGVVILPTDTVYGIVCDAFCEESVRRIYNIKKRNLNNPVSVMVSNMKMIEMISDNITNIEKKIIAKFFPGAITIILNKNESIKRYVTGQMTTVGIRMPDNKMLLDIIEIFRQASCGNKL